MTALPRHRQHPGSRLHLPEGWFHLPRHRHQDAPEPNILFGVGGANGVTIDNKFTGIVVAPWATVTLGNRTGEYRGSFFARSIVATATKVEHEPLERAQFCAADSPCTSFCACGANTPGCSSSDQCDGWACSITASAAVGPVRRQDLRGRNVRRLRRAVRWRLRQRRGRLLVRRALSLRLVLQDRGWLPGTGTCRPLTCRINNGCGPGDVDCGGCAACTPECEGKNCGPDGCGGECGTTPPDKICLDGQISDATGDGHTAGFQHPWCPALPRDRGRRLPGSFHVSDAAPPNTPSR